MPPRLDRLARIGEREEQMVVEALVAKFAVERFDEGILHRLTGFDVVPLESPVAQRSTAPLVSSVPLSLTTIRGKARSAARRSSSRTTRTPPSEVSTTVARHSRLKSSTTHRMRKRRPSLSVSDAKSSDQRAWI